ncbi:HTH domain-containing protein [Streptomyces kaniharaensis]|uniref:HTH domain-containing protein n=1 Tax=Streptomyces kaniharaensis TaxID=212423 RepID=A0A6N7KWJ9_9ACTN|nr:HTH domain-containing protein [Streptomyces kaniharaensis]MQS14989.1 HTH domain-containing protein [Streptomyces kaniharaensis]
MRASRLMSIVLLLQSRGLMTARALAEELDVSVRTVYRDVEALSASGVPVYGEGGRDGGYRLLDGYRTRLTGLTPCEAETLFLLPMAGPASDLGLASYAASAQLKIAAALPAEVGDHAARIGSRFLIDGDSWRRDAPGVGRLPVLAQAVKDEQAVEVRYRTPDGNEDEVHAVSPYGMVLEAGAWYLVAAHTPGTTPMVLPVSWVRATAPSLHDFRPPADFDLRTFWAARTAGATPSGRLTGQSL